MGNAFQFDTDDGISVWQCVASAGLAGLIWLVILLIGPNLRPTIITYPWATPASSEQRTRDKEQVVVIAGSYNPLHNGHCAMIQYLASRYGKVIAVVGMNANKKYTVTPDERKELIQQLVQAGVLPNNVQAEVVSGYIWKYAKTQNATILFRGIRSWAKDGRDENTLQIQNTWGPIVCGPFVWPLPTFYMEGKPEYNNISSTLVRDLCKNGTPDESLLKLVPLTIADSIANVYSRTESN